MSPASRRRRAALRRDLFESLRFFVVLLGAALFLRSFVVAPFAIPSESMLPRLLPGDLILVAKWPYGYSRHSLPLGAPLWSGRILERAPARGDVVVFKTPADNRTDFVKRVIGLPGDRIALRAGVIILNGKEIPRFRTADFLDPVTPNSACRTQPGMTNRSELRPEGGRVCRYRRYRETLPNGRAWSVLDLGAVPAADDTDAYVVPAGHYFLLGDNRDRSADSRFPAGPGGIGFVPAENLVGRALLGLWSTDGTMRWNDPRTWIAATRWERIGAGF